MDTEINLPYGDSFLKARIPTKNITSILRTKDIKGLDNEREAITNSLRLPIRCPALRTCVNKNDKVVVIVTDNTRPCPDDRLLPPILAGLEEKLPRENITIIVALGLHPPLDKHFAGFSGGRKSIAPGVFSARSAYKNHSYKMIEHPRARAGILKGNPIHEDLVEQAKMAKLNFIVNVLLNKKREITHVVAGDPIKAHERGCEIERDIAGVKVAHKVDITITTNSGAPLDLDFYQTCKGIDTASQITRDGGIIIIASSCCAGVGPEEFRALHAAVSSPKEVLQKIRRAEPIGVQWENQILARTQMKNDIYLVSSLEDSVVKDMMITPIHTIEEGLEKAFMALGSDAEVAIIPEGPLVLPLLEN